MEDYGGEDEKKFDVETQQEEETQPDPDESSCWTEGTDVYGLSRRAAHFFAVCIVEFRPSQGSNLGDIPKHLMARWAAIDKEDVHLATIRIYPNAVSPSGRSPRIFLFLPPDPNDPTPRAPDLPQFPSNAAYVPVGEGGVQVDRYELDMVNGSVENQLVVAERPKDIAAPSSATTSYAYNSRARTTILTGRIKHECNLRPLFNESYRLHMRERSRAYNTPKRQIRMIEEAGVSGGRGGINRLSTGISTGSFADMIKAKQKPVKGTFEQQPRWNIKPLRERTQQPEAYLKEVLNEIATLHRSGEYNGMWELSEIFAREGVKAENAPGANYDEEDDDDDDMEEVS
ncbi:transcription initiation factor IIF, beta subunit-domain-containing protein [Pisolithus albus]|nr:transcription initiation factor IIF, beta subunit-domain-containing protein [Pisolithus albus]